MKDAQLTQLLAGHGYKLYFMEGRELETRPCAHVFGSAAQRVIRAAIAGLPKPIPNDSRGSSGTTGSNVTEKKLPNILSLSCVHSSEATPWNFNWLILLG